MTRKKGDRRTFLTTGKGGGFMAAIREAKPARWPVWSADITDYFTGAGETKYIGSLSGYRKLAKYYGYMLRSRNGRIEVCVLPNQNPR